jgi:hypothetical protein
LVDRNIERINIDKRINKQEVIGYRMTNPTFLPG